MDKQAHLKWLVTSRGRIQLLSLNILTQIRAVKDLDQKSTQRAVAGLMVGAVFSLWRAVFLAEVPNAWPKLLETADKFLEKIVEHNSITYMDDYYNRARSFGYSLNNANFRVHDIVAHSSIGRDALTAANLNDVWDEVANRNPPQEAWDRCCLALEIIFGEFSKV